MKTFVLLFIASLGYATLVTSATVDPAATDEEGMTTGAPVPTEK